MIFDADTGNGMVLVDNVSIWEYNIADGVVVFVDSQPIEFIDFEFIGNQGTPISIPNSNFTVFLCWGL